MSVEHTGVSQIIEANDVVYYNDHVVKAIAQAAMVSMAEANVDMVCDQGNEYPTKADIERAFQGLHDQAHDVIDDMFDELKARVLEELAVKRYTARVTGLRYDNNGDLADVDVAVNFKDPLDRVVTVDKIAV